MTAGQEAPKTIALGQAATPKIELPVMRVNVPGQDQWQPGTGEIGEYTKPQPRSNCRRDSLPK